ncbi:MAG TPA: hypothetical protein VFP72_01265 [Kineosporiaceae bacterium]|nr:hypothetical protein [Kineosporiaceae bacterium]
MRPITRWLVPVAVAATIAGGSAASSAMAGAAVSLPDRTPRQVLAAVAASRVQALSGTITTHADLGLPALPSIGGHGRASTADPQALLTRFLAGDNTIRVWLDGPQHQRAQLVDPFAELDVVHDGSQLWTYDSHTGSVRKTTLPAHPAAKAAPAKPNGTMPHDAAAPDLRSMTPAEVADRVLAAVDPTTTVTVGASQRVADRDAYTLLITPKTDATLVGHVAIAVDAASGLPLRVTVWARGHADPALETGFTTVDLSRPSASVFGFSPPKSATVQPLPLPSGQDPSPGSPPGGTGAAEPTVHGSGWATIVELPADQALAALGGPLSSTGQPSTGRSATTQQARPGARSGSASGAALLDQLTTPVAGGGRALRTALLTVLVTADGRVLAGSVPLPALQAVAAR